MVKYSIFDKYFPQKWPSYLKQGPYDNDMNNLSWSTKIDYLTFFFTLIMLLNPRISKLITRCISTEKALSLMTPSEKLDYLKTLEANAEVTYKRYPYLPHQDPKSPEYIHSELDQYHDSVEVKAYNEVIDNFKNDLKVQREVWEAINNLDRPYKRGVPGVDKNIDPNGVAKPKLQDLGFPRRDPQNQYVFTFANEDRFIANTPFHYASNFKHIKEWQEQRRNRPVTRDFSSKGYKYDVPVKPEEKFEYVADRLGHPEFVGHPLEWLLRLENDIFHPTYLDQPFVKTPSPKPHESLNFEQGEVLYENTRVMEWIKFWQMTAVTAGAFGGMFVPYCMAFKTNLITDAADELLQMQYHLVTPSTIDIMRLSIPIVAGASYYVVHALVNYTNHFLSDYVAKMSYSKDKQLLFVKRVDNHGLTEEEVFEMAHLEILPPSHKAGVGAMSSQDEDGLWRITCLNSQRTMLVYSNPKNWNSELRAEFFKRTLGLWDKSYYGFTRDEEAENKRKWREQVLASFTQEALPKH